MTEKDGYLVGARRLRRPRHGGDRARGDDPPQREQTCRSARDVILAWTGDEESGGGGIRWLLENAARVDRRPRSSLNEGGGVQLDDRRQADASSSCRPRRRPTRTSRSRRAARPATRRCRCPTTPIYRLARALDAARQHRFPARLLPVTRAWLREREPLEQRRARRRDAHARRLDGRAAGGRARRRRAEPHPRRDPAHAPASRR